MQNDIFWGKEFFDYAILDESIKALKSKYDFIETGSIGYSIMGRSLHKITLGKGSKNVLFIGAHHGMEWITSAILMRFINDFASDYIRGRHAFGISTRVLFETRKIHVIPMLNPDGVEYSLHGVEKSNILRDRLIKMNAENDDFSHWQANARGVDLNHNYSSGFSQYKIIEKELKIPHGAPTKYSGDYSESEPETKALCNFVRIVNPSLALSLHTQGEEIFYTSGSKSATNSLPIVKTVARLTGYKISMPSGTASYGGFTDWFVEEFDKPSLTLECGRGTNPLPYSDLDKIYSCLKRAFFTAPILI